MRLVVTGGPCESGLSSQDGTHAATIALYGQIRQKDVRLTLPARAAFKDWFRTRSGWMYPAGVRRESAMSAWRIRCRGNASVEGVRTACSRIAKIGIGKKARPGEKQEKMAEFRKWFPRDQSSQHPGSKPVAVVHRNQRFEYAVGDCQRREQSRHMSDSDEQREGRTTALVPSHKPIRRFFFDEQANVV